MMAIQVTLSVEGDAPAPTLKDVLDSMTPDDKSKLAADIAYRYFAAGMEESYKPYQYSRYDTRYKADDYLKELSQQVKNDIARRLADDPTLNAKIEAVLDIVRPQLASFIQNAVVTILSGKLAEEFQRLANLEQQQFDVAEKLKKIGMGT